MKRTMILILVVAVLAIIANAAFASANGGINPLVMRDAVRSARSDRAPAWERGGDVELQSANGGINPLLW